MRRWTTSTAPSSSDSSRNFPRRPAAVIVRPVRTRRELSRRLAPHGPATEHSDLDDPSPYESALEPPADGLDFGKLGHLCDRFGRVACLPGFDDLERDGGRDALGDLLRGSCAAA